MKRWIIIIISILLAVGIGFGVFFGIKSCNDKDASNPNKTEYEISLISDSYAVGDTVVYRVLVCSDVQMERMVYVLNNGEEQTITCKTGESKDAKDTVGKGKYFIDTDTEVLDSTSMTAGYYTLVFYTYDAEGTRYAINADPVIFKLTVS